jgi:hypothetical protein
MDKKGQSLYTVRRDVKCLSCGCKGAIQRYGTYYPRGLGEKAEGIEVLEPYRDKPYLSRAMGFGGTIPYECMNCGNIGLIDIGGLEGYQQAFVTLFDGDFCVDLAKRIMKRYPTKEEKVYVVRFPTDATKFRVYEDEWIEIQMAVDTKAMMIEIKQPHRNPVIILNDEGKFLRCHGERAYFLNHAKKLLGMIEND